MLELKTHKISRKLDENTYELVTNTETDTFDKRITIDEKLIENYFKLSGADFLNDSHVFMTVTDMNGASRVRTLPLTSQPTSYNSTSSVTISADYGNLDITFIMKLSGSSKPKYSVELSIVPLNMIFTKQELIRLKHVKFELFPSERLDMFSASPIIVIVADKKINFIKQMKNTALSFFNLNKFSLKMLTSSK